MNKVTHKTELSKVIPKMGDIVRNEEGYFIVNDYDPDKMAYKIVNLSTGDNVTVLESGFKTFLWNIMHDGYEITITVGEG